MRLALLIAAVSVVALSGAFGLGPIGGGPDEALATHGKNCGIVSKGSRNYRVLGQRLRCGRARKGARLYLREGRPLRGFSCAGPAGVYEFICGSGGKTYRAKRL
jgi:hypothetical protein